MRKSNSTSTYFVITALGENTKGFFFSQIRRAEIPLEVVMKTSFIVKVEKRHQYFFKGVFISLKDL